MGIKKVKQLKQIVGPALAVDVVVFTIKESELSLLLLKAKDPNAEGGWVLPGGFVKLEEALDEAARGLLDAKTNININYLEQLYTFGEIRRDTRGRVVTTAYFALVDYKKFRLKTTPAYSDIGWFPVTKLPKIGYDHEKVIKKATTRIRNKLAYSNVVCHLLPKAFTLTCLQEVYGATLGRKLDKRNFRRKILSSGIIKELGRKERFAAHRPARLYKFISRRYKEMELI